MLRPLIRPLAMRGLLFKERLRSGVSFNPLAPAFQQDPYPKYAELRERDPVHWGVLTKAWVLSRYEHVDAILRDPARFASDERRAGDQAPAYENPLGEERSLLRLDPPDHTRLRTLVTRAFTPRAIESMALRVREIVETQLDPVRDGATVDIMAVLAYPLPVTVIAEMLGVPSEDRDRFKVWSNAVARTLEPTISPHEIGGAVRAAQELAEYFRGIIAARRQQPREDLISGLIAAEEEGDKLTESEMLVMLRLLLVAGNETTTNLIGNGLLALLRNPDQLQCLRDDPSLTESAVEELLRFDSPVQVDARVALEDTEVDGHLIKRGQRTLLLIGSANHDTAVFTAPDQLDVARDGQPHISFGRGIHHCLGAPLARLEGRIAFEVLLDRFSEMRLATERPQFKDHVILRGLEALPVTVKR